MSLPCHCRVTNVSPSPPQAEDLDDDDDELAPLGPGEKRIKEDSDVFIHKPATNIRDKLQVS